MFTLWAEAIASEPQIAETDKRNLWGVFQKSSAFKIAMYSQSAFSSSSILIDRVPAAKVLRTGLDM
jgi:hypothetical protein